MKPKRIVLVRHGRSEANDDVTVYSRVPDYKVNLVEAGREQARIAGARIAGIIGDESYGIYVSPYARTLQTRDCILSMIPRVPVFDYQDPCLREQDMGNLPTPEDSEEQRRTRGEFGAFFYRFPQGESCADVYDRMSGFNNSLYRLFAKPECPENLLIVTHSVAMRCFLARWYRWSVEYFDSLPLFPNCHIVVLERDEDGKYRLIEPMERVLTQEGVISLG